MSELKCKFCGKKIKSTEISLISGSNIFCGYSCCEKFTKKGTNIIDKDVYTINLEEKYDGNPKCSICDGRAVYRIVSRAEEEFHSFVASNDGNFLVINNKRIPFEPFCSCKLHTSDVKILAFKQGEILREEINKINKDEKPVNKFSNLDLD